MAPPLQIDESGARRLRDSAPVPGEPHESDFQHVQESVADLVRRSLIQLGDMESMQERIKRVGERLSQITPPAEHNAPQQDWTSEDQAQAS